MGSNSEVTQRPLLIGDIQVGNYLCVTFQWSPDSAQPNYKCAARITAVYPEGVEPTFQIQRLDTLWNLESKFPFYVPGNGKGVRSTMHPISAGDAHAYMADHHEYLQKQASILEAEMAAEIAAIQAQMAASQAEVDSYYEFAVSLIPQEQIAA